MGGGPVQRVAGLVERAQPRQFRTVSQVSVLAPRVRALAAPSNRLAFLATSAPLPYEACAWSGEVGDDSTCKRDET